MASPLALALMQGNQAAAPQAPFRATVAPTDVEKAHADYNNAMMQAYAAKVGQQNAMWGGLAGLGGAGITTLPKLLSGSGAAGGALSAADTAAAADAMGVTAADIGAGTTMADLLPLLLL